MGNRVSLPPYPLRALGLGRRELRTLYGDDRYADWRDDELEIGRAPRGAKFCAVRHASFESFVPIGRGLAPVFRYLIRSRAAVLRGTVPHGQEDVPAMSFESAPSFVQLGVTSADVGALPRSYVGGIPPSVVSVIGARS